MTSVPSRKLAEERPSSGQQLRRHCVIPQPPERRLKRRHRDRSLIDALRLAGAGQLGHFRAAQDHTHVLISKTTIRALRRQRPDLPFGPGTFDPGLTHEPPQRRGPVVNDQSSERREVVRGGGSQGFHRSVPPRRHCSHRHVEVR